MRITLIHNPDAGDDKQPDAAELQRLIAAAGHEVRPQSCRDEHWAAALSHPADLVVIAGGDGTVGRVAKALVGKRLPFTALPLGTANNISRTFGLTNSPLDELIAGWDRGRRTRFDVGVARGPWGLRYFIEGIGAGLFASTMPEAHRSRTLAQLDSADARVAYALQMLRERLQQCAASRFHVTLDGRDLTGDYLLLEAMNMQYVGPNLYLGPQCDLRDGLLDAVFVREEERDKLHEYLSTWQNGTLHMPDFVTYRGRELRVQWTDFHVHIDDDLWPPPGEEVRATAPREIQVRMEPGGLEFLVPAR